ncbi:MAG: ASKHA domain-containing protein [Bacillota bacterium]
MVKITFLPSRKEIDVDPGTNLLQAAALAGVPLEGICGGKGTCGKCRVRIVAGEAVLPSPAELKFFSREELTGGSALACQKNVNRNTTVKTENQANVDDRKTALQGQPAVPAMPYVEKYHLKLKHPTVDDQSPDLERLLVQLPLPEPEINLSELAKLPRVIRSAAYAVTAVLSGRHLIAVEPGDTTHRSYGLAFDIGTTTIMGSLLDLNSGAVLAVGATTNPQSIYGADVISRITHAAQNGGGLQQLQEKVISAANAITGELLAATGIGEDEVYEAVVVGNTTMSHLFLGIDPTYLAPAPFIPAYRQPVTVKASELNLSMHPSGRVTVLPNIAGYVGSDTVGVILAADLDRRRDTCLAIDIGTNGELVLTAAGRVLTCSTAAGPAFEGAQIRHGMRAAAGAVEAVTVNEDVQLKVIGGTAPRGICGSGLIDAVAELLAAGIIEPSGRFTDPESGAGASLPPRLRERLRRGQGGYEFVLAWGKEYAGGADLVLTQPDLRELQLAKGAIYAGIKILLKEAGLELAALDAVLLAGAFGNYIRKESALAIGLLPALPPERIVPVGNAAGDGARMALIARPVRERAFALPERVEHVELSTRPDFQKEFISALAFPK